MITTLRAFYDVLAHQNAQSVDVNFNTEMSIPISFLFVCIQNGNLPNTGLTRVDTIFRHS